MTKLIDAANRYGIAVMGVTAVGRAMERTPAYFESMYAETSASAVYERSACE